jgi:hypothetical protein
VQNAYLGTSSLSRRRRLDTLRGLDDNLLRDWVDTVLMLRSLRAS